MQIELVRQVLLRTDRVFITAAAWVRGVEDLVALRESYEHSRY